MEFLAKINKLREQIHQVKEELQWLATAPIAREDFKVRVAEWVDRMGNHSEGVENSFRALHSPSATTASHSDALRVKAHIKVVKLPHVEDAMFSIAPQLVWLFGEQIKEILLAKVDAMDYVPGLPLAERPKRRQLLQQQLRNLEEKEEALICESEDAHAPVFRRADADPAVVLNYEPGRSAGVAEMFIEAGGEAA